MKALTVQQPWAWAIIHGGKDVENRSQLWKYRGPLAIHAGARISERGLDSALVQQARLRETGNPAVIQHELALSALLGVVDLVDVHEAQPETHAFGSTYAAACCDSPWGEQTWHGRRGLVHLVLENPRPLSRPIPCKGRLGLWTPPPDVLDELREA